MAGENNLLETRLVTRMKLERARKGLTAITLSKLLDVSPSTYSRYESAEIKLPKRRAIILSYILECPPEELQKPIVPHSTNLTQEVRYGEREDSRETPRPERTENQENARNGGVSV